MWDYFLFRQKSIMCTVTKWEITRPHKRRWIGGEMRNSCIYIYIYLYLYFQLLMWGYFLFLQKSIMCTITNINTTILHFPPNPSPVVGSSDFPLFAVTGSRASRSGRSCSVTEQEARWAEFHLFLYSEQNFTSSFLFWADFHFFS